MEKQLQMFSSASEFIQQAAKKVCLYMEEPERSEQLKRLEELMVENCAAEDKFRHVILSALKYLFPHLKQMSFRQISATLYCVYI